MAEKWLSIAITAFVGGLIGLFFSFVKDLLFVWFQGRGRLEVQVRRVLFSYYRFGDTGKGGWGSRTERRKEAQVALLEVDVVWVNRSARPIVVTDAWVTLRNRGQDYRIQPVDRHEGKTFGMYRVEGNDSCPGWLSARFNRTEETRFFFEGKKTQVGLLITTRQGKTTEVALKWEDRD
ncbi:hypothetical protein JQC72_03135 [Polycladomyces sp. WAk]|uniref:DUF4352 domain-containing protein n=1 Tax=Polycladomyces zharkentensis TaxID=2807616 RepID=A0ABS2WG43_9BACL|nr:hypothetical protein [Polycladomyces sp. WAk]MBN2908512.1 hypothetical protein [Polycladomyces sp. WAk]